jgi:hypothetical protein
VEKAALFQRQRVHRFVASEKEIINTSGEAQRVAFNQTRFGIFDENELLRDLRIAIFVCGIFRLDSLSRSNERLKKTEEVTETPKSTKWFFFKSVPSFGGDVKLSVSAIT